MHFGLRFGRIFGAFKQSYSNTAFDWILRGSRDSAPALSFCNIRLHYFSSLPPDELSEKASTLNEFAKGAVQYRKDILMWSNGKIEHSTDLGEKEALFNRELPKIQEVVRKNLLPKLDDINQLIFNATSKESIEQIAEMFHTYRLFVRPITCRSTKPFMRVCCQLGYPEMALSMLLNRQNYLLTPSRNCIHLLMLRFGFEAMRPDYFKNMFVSFALLEEHNIGVSGFSYYILLEGCLNSGTQEGLDKALICADEALSLGLRLPPSFYATIMTVCLRQHRPDQAISWFEKAVFKRSKEIYSLAASAYESLDQPSKAIECREAIQHLLQDNNKTL